MKLTKVFYKNAESTARITINQGGTSSSKTYSILQLLLYIALKSKRSLIISVVSESLPHLKRGALRDFINILKGDGVYSEKFHNKTDNSFTLNNSVIEFFSVDDEKRVRGARRDVLFVNECNNIKYDTFTQLEVRTRSRIFLDFNPVSEFWVHEKVMTGLFDINFIKSTYKDNDYLSSNIIKAIESRRNDVNWWRVYGLGELGQLEDLVFTNWETLKEMPFLESYYFGLDFGYTNDPTALIKVANKNGNIYLDEMIYQTKLTNQDISHKFSGLGLRKRDDEIIADSAEPKSIQEIYRDGWNIRPTKKGADSIVNGIDILTRHNMYVTERSINLIKELRNYTWSKDKDNKMINKPIDAFNHAIDAIRYAAIIKIGYKADYESAYSYS
jgi:phage terminase large subunit